MRERLIRKAIDWLRKLQCYLEDLQGTLRSKLPPQSEPEKGTIDHVLWKEGERILKSNELYHTYHKSPWLSDLFGPGPQ